MFLSLNGLSGCVLYQTSGNPVWKFIRHWTNFGQIFMQLFRPEFGMSLNWEFTVPIGWCNSGSWYTCPLRMTSWALFTSRIFVCWSVIFWSKARMTFTHPYWHGERKQKGTMERHAGEGRQPPHQGRTPQSRTGTGWTKTRVKIVLIHDIVGKIQLHFRAGVMLGHPVQHKWRHGSLDGSSSSFRPFVLAPSRGRHWKTGFDNCSRSTLILKRVINVSQRSGSIHTVEDNTATQCIMPQILNI